LRSALQLSENRIQPVAPSGLPIDQALPALRVALIQGNSAVLQAPPGAGKSTVVPLALLDAPWLKRRKILMLEPRRLAARAVASRMATSLGEPVGQTVGYRMRLDTRVSAATRIEVVTEGVLTRMLHADPALEGVGAVLFDEFHERNLQADLGLALLLQARRALETDLRIVVMSATLDGAAIAALLDDAPVVRCEGRTFDVAVHYLGSGFPLLPGGAESPERAVLLAVQRALREHDGDVLVFLPGAAEIRRVQSMLEGTAPRAGFSNPQLLRVLPLYGELDATAQDLALRTATDGCRQIILATNIAETSLTIPGIRVVVDSGLARRSRFDPVTGMSRLETVRISRAAAEQRRGRAGRVADGVCYRLWSEGSHRSLGAFTPPEILDADLAALALDLARWGAQDAADLRWLDPPPAAVLGSARDLLRRLGALDPEQRLTARGRRISELPLHPRLAQLLLVAAEHGVPDLGADLAALLTERDLLRRVGASNGTDISLRLDLLRRSSTVHQVDARALERVRRISAQLRRALPRERVAVSSAERQTGAAGMLLAAAWPDRIGRLRAAGERRYLLSNGRGAQFERADTLSQREFIVVLDVDDSDRDARIQLAAALDRDDIDAALAGQIESEAVVEWLEREQAVAARQIERLDALVLSDRPWTAPPERTAAAMLLGLRSMGLGALPWSDEARALQARVEFVRVLPDGRCKDWPLFTDAALLAELDIWLAPWLAGVTRRSQLAAAPLLDALRARLGHARQSQLDSLAPTHLTLPTGSRARIDYLDDLAPCAAMRMQEVFGMADTPRIGGGRVAVTFKLLSPAQRPLQVTRDLASFWRNAYREVRKDMRGRYPKHYWPENPLQAEPTRGVRRPRQ